MAVLCERCSLPQALHVPYVWMGSDALRCPTPAEQEVRCVCGHPARFHVDQLPYTRCLASCGCAGFTIYSRCDFCSASPAPWVYPTLKASVQYGIVTEQDGQIVSRRTPEHVSLPGWAACDGCSELIERGDRQALMDRAPVDLTIVPPDRRREARQVLLDFQAQTFWNVRSGKRRRG